MINLYRATRSANLTQPFGWNRAIVKLGADGQPLRPYQVRAIGDHDAVPEGWARFYTAVLGMLGHNGRDWAAWRGEPAYFSATDGNCGPIEATCFTETDQDGGRGVDIVFQDPDAGAWWQLKEWHLLSATVYDGQKIKSGDQFGLCDSTGASSGDHLHDGLKPLNSSNLEDKAAPDNGYTGAVNPATAPNVRDYQEDSFILDVLNLKQQLTLLQQIIRIFSILKGRGWT